MQLVVSVFPGGGKSTICKNAEAYGLRQAHVSYDDRDGVGISLLAGPGVPVFDSDSSNFPKDNFPANYIEHIKGVLADYPDVVIMVSSHDNVRQAMTEANIPYTLVYPQRELKSEFLERYEERGSPEAFVNMMDNKWNDFIDSSESDPAPDHIILSEGDYLVDKIYDRIKEVVQSTGAEMPSRGGFESIGDIIRAPDGKTFDSSSTESMEEYRLHCAALAAATVPVVEETPLVPAETTAAIVDVNADAETVVAVAIPAEPVGDVAVGVVSSPEGEEVTTLTAEPLEGGQPAVDASTVDDSAMDHSDMVEAHYDVKEDIESIELLLTQSALPEMAGNEAFNDSSEILTNAVSVINDRYGAAVEPTLAGMEGFLDKLKTLYEVTKSKLKKDPAKKGKINKHVPEAEKAVNEYKSDTWLNKQKFINVGKVKLQAPTLLSTVNSTGDVKTIIDLITKQTVTAFDKHIANDKARIIAANKVFNKVKNLSSDEPISKLEELLPIKPEDLVGGPKDAGLTDLKLSMVTIEVPVLSKDGVKEVCAILDSMLDEVGNFFKKEDSLDDTHISEDDWFDSEYLEEHMQTAAAGQLWNAGTYYSDVPEYAKIDEEYSKVLLEVGKFLENWILKSTK